MTTITRFITATGTGIGKTLVTAALAHQLRAQGKLVEALKPVLTGFAPQTRADSDPAILLAALGRPVSAESIAEVSPFRFAAPLAPAMAAAKEAKQITCEALVAASRRRSERTEIVLVEGIGGVMVPLFAGVTTLEWMAQLRYPAILVTGSYLGSLSHTLTALEAMRTRAIPLVGIVVSETAESSVELFATVRAIQEFIAAPVLALARIVGAEPWRRAPDLTMLMA